MTFKEALNQFTDEMEKKFRARDAKHGDLNIVRMTTKQVADLSGLYHHLAQEVRELANAPTDRDEIIDVANMCFALWWRQYAREKRDLTS